MIRNDSFWELEIGAPLLKKNAGFVNKADVQILLDRAAQWVDMVAAKGPVELPAWISVCDDKESQRIFQLDAQRTFTDPSNRNAFTETLATIYQEIKDYHQGLGFIVAFLLLFLDKETAAKIALGLHRYYVPGYFKAAPVAYVRDAKTFEKMLQIRNPKVFNHVNNLIPAEAYCSKWFVGFNVHVLTFSALAEFLEALFSGGGNFHFQYAMALVDNITGRLMATNDVSKILALLRLDAKEYPDATSSTENGKEGSFFGKIVEDARACDLNDIDIDSMRQDILEEMAAYDVKRRQRDLECDAKEDEDEIVFSDED